MQTCLVSWPEWPTTGGQSLESLRYSHDTCDPADHFSRRTNQNPKAIKRDWNSMSRLGSQKSVQSEFGYLVNTIQWKLDLLIPKMRVFQPLHKTTQDMQAYLQTMICSQTGYKKTRPWRDFRKNFVCRFVWGWIIIPGFISTNASHCCYYAYTDTFEIVDTVPDGVSIARFKVNNLKFCPWLSCTFCTRTVSILEKCFAVCWGCRMAWYTWR